MHWIVTPEKQNRMKRLIDKIGRTLAARYEKEELSAIVRAVCCDMLDIPTTTYYIKEEIALTAEQEARLEEILCRLQQGEPLQYIEGKAPFCGMEFAVRPGVLIPRPETTELVDWVVQDYDSQSPRLLDMGTGSGCIAVALDKQLPGAEVEACDISLEALAIAKGNNERNGASVTFFKHDILDLTVPLPHSHNIIVSNPPYIMQSEHSTMEQHVTEWEPHTALFVPDEDALCFYRAIAEIGMTEALEPGGSIYVEINQALGAETVALFESYGYKEVTLRRDIFGNNRMVKAVKSKDL